MKIRLPRDLRSSGLGLVSPFDLNTFDIDLVLPAIFFSVLSEGRSRAKPKVNNPEDVERYIDLLSKHPDVIGFASDEGKRLLGRIVRTSLAQMGAIGRGRTGGEQIVAVVPLSLLAHKPGFPTMSGRLRGVDAFVFRILRDQMGSTDQLKDLFRRYFGRGVDLRPVPQLGGAYDGHTHVDVMTRLHLALMDVFESTSSVERRSFRVATDCCVGVSDAIAKDLLRYLFAYNDVMPVEELTRKFAALLNFEIFVYTMKLVYGLNQLVADPSVLPNAFAPSFVASPPAIFVDFTRSPTSLSSQLSAACVRRDLEALYRFMHSTRLVTQLSNYVGAIRRSQRSPSSGTQSSAERIQELLMLRRAGLSADVEAAARVDENRIRTENEQDNEEEASPLSYLDSTLDQAPDDIERVVQIVLASQGKSLYQSLAKWYWGTGGLTKPHGILWGRLKGRASWRYQPSDELLIVLVQLAAAEISRSTPGAPIRLQDVLEFLWNRFGLAISHSVPPFEGAEYAAAARENLQAMLARLRQMGIFDDLSDDFTVQTLAIGRQRAGA